MPIFSSETIDDDSKILNLMKESKIYWQVKRELLTSIANSYHSSSNSHHSSKKILSQSSVDQIIKALVQTQKEDRIIGLISNCLQKSTRRLPIQIDSVPEIEFSRQKWSQMITKQFNNIANRIIKNEEYDEQDESVNYTYDCSSLLQFLASIKNKSLPIQRQSSVFLFGCDLIKVASYQQVRNKFAFLNSGQNLMGDNKDFEIKEREKRANQIVNGQNIASEIQNYLMYGCLSTQRVNVYTRYFECFYQYTAKRVDFLLYQKVWKPIIRLDCKEILKDPQYFVFKEELEKVYKLFICDKQVSQMVKIRQLTPNPQLDKYSPIHHILPSKSFSSYMAPFCYCSTSSQEIYELFREVYCNYFINLNVISSQTDGILGLCILFQQLLSTTEKKLVQKFESLAINPLRLFFPWIFYCFIGYLQIEQFFLMLDRIIGTKSLEILPLYCVSILFKCKTLILQAKSESDIIQIVVDEMREDIWLETIRNFFKYHL